MNQMKRIARRLFLVLIMLWLPLQGAFAGVVPPCAHEEDTNNKFNFVDIPIVDERLHTNHNKQPMSSHMASSQECEVNALCHISCSTFIALAFSNEIPTNNISYNIAIIAKPVSFIPEQLQRPPLV
ncbi:MAG: hypothetical protein KF908_12245 [Nitrosomonas sp.]|nr:hypothetical protein [Nitrosomonas sp.]